MWQTRGSLPSMRPLAALCLLISGCAGVRVEATRVGAPAPVWEGSVRIAATLPEGRTHQVAFFEAECRGACLSRLLRQLRLAVPRFGGNVGYVDRIGVRLTGAVHRHADVTVGADGVEAEQTRETVHEGVVTRLEGRALLVYGEAR